MAEMTRCQAKRLYRLSVDADVDLVHEPASWWDSVQEDLEAVIAAKTDRGAGRVILWWDCWDRDLTATACARKIRKTWMEMQLREWEKS